MREYSRQRCYREDQQGDAEKHRPWMDDFSEGLGIGLAFCKNIALKLGGDVTLDNNNHDGARFIVTIPLR